MTTTVQEAVTRGQQLRAEREEAKRRAEEATEEETRRQQLLEWAPVLDEIRRHLPEWAHEHLQPGVGTPTFFGDDYDRMVCPAYVTVDNSVTVLAYALERDGAWSCGFLPVDYVRDGERYRPVAQDRRHQVLEAHEIIGANARTDDFLVALAYSSDNLARRYRREEEELQRAVEPAPGSKLGEETPDPIDQALALAAILSRNDFIKQTPIDPDGQQAEDMADDRTLLLAAGQTAIAHHVRRCADALERLIINLRNLS